MGIELDQYPDGICNSHCHLRKMLAMIRLTTALLTLGVGMAIATTAIAQEGWWAVCNPNAPMCRSLSGPDPVVANHQTTEACTCTRHDTAPARTEQARIAAIRCATKRTPSLDMQA